MEWQAATFSGIDWHGGEEGSQNTSSKYKFFKVLLVFVINGCNLVARLNNYRASMDAGLSTNAGPNINADASMDADMDPGSLGLQPIDRIRLWVELTPDQSTLSPRSPSCEPYHQCDSQQTVMSQPIHYRCAPLLELLVILEATKNLLQQEVVLSSTVG